MYYNFVGRRKIWFLVSLLIIAAGIFSLMTQGINFGIDFVGGTKVMLAFSQEVGSEDIRQVLADYNLENSIIQDAGNNQFIIRTPIITEAESTNIIDALKDKHGDIVVLSNESVGSVVSSELKDKSLIALAIATLLMVVYITVRFELIFALSAVIALIHDVLITLSVFSLFQIEVNISFVAALLTIIGYSINDTIVIFDKIRENLLYRKKESFVEIVNKGISQSLVRSINTSLTSIVVLLALLFFGGETTKVFALAMTIGFVSGTYSSIFIASPLWLELRDRGFSRYSRKRRNPKHATS
ncbi:MAG: protein translocase subunit SecF [Bacillota bacterium]